jgi:SAM-dependent methyltransferase
MWNSARLGFFVVDDGGVYVGTLSHTDLHDSPIHRPGTGDDITVGDLCNRKARIVECAALNEEEAVAPARKIFADIPSIFYVPVIGGDGKPLGYVYRSNNSITSNSISWDKGDGWTIYDDGEGWSSFWGSSEAQWHGAIRPRIAPWLPSGTILEIAPGHGRWTRFLLAEAKAYHGVELSGECAEFCRARFCDAGHASFHQNDGRTIPMVGDRSCDFIFSFDSLVHVEMDALKSYIEECARILKPGGVAFLHHSNMGVYADPFNPDWFAYDVSHAGVKEHIERIGCFPWLQEGVHWCYGADRCNACFTVFSNRPPKEEFRFFVNEFFMQEAMLIKTRIDRYMSLA